MGQAWAQKTGCKERGGVNKRWPLDHRDRGGLDRQKYRAYSYRPGGFDFIKRIKNDLKYDAR